MKSVQKFGSLLLAALMILSLTACGSKTSNDTPAQTPSNGTTTEDTPAETPDDAATGDADNTASGSKVLVVYYSASGNTKRVAEDIAEAADGDLFEITPAEPYTTDDLNWTNSDSRVSREHDDESLRDVPLTTTEVENWDDYDTVFIGYPIWWGIAAWPVDTFVKNNDFTGKTVIPFATSSSSGMGQSGTLLSEMAGTGDWQDGCSPAVRRRRRQKVTILPPSRSSLRRTPPYRAASPKTRRWTVRMASSISATICRTAMTAQRLIPSSWLCRGMGRCGSGRIPQAATFAGTACRRGRSCRSL